VETPRISVLVPTRNRPDSVRRLRDSIRATAHGAVELVLYVDDDDPTGDTVCDLAAGDLYLEVLVGSRIVLSETWNRCAEQASASVLMHCGDDIVFRTPGWDQRVLTEFDDSVDKILLVHGRDGFQDAGLATHGFLHRRWVDALGYFVPPYFASDYNDLWLTEVADALGRRRYLADVYTEHLHPVVGKAPLDVTHQERLARHQRENVDQLYRDLKPQREADIAKLRAVMS
jgi:glycosyltransferase involved in cell wall biosynthesis